MGILTRTKKQEKKGPTKQNAVLKVVHPHGYTEVFCEPITAGEIMKRYPRHCITRPDIFEYPWIVVSPESLLVPGKVFYLVPHYTLDSLMKSKRHQLEKQQQEISYSRAREEFHESWNEMRRAILEQDKGGNVQLLSVKPCLRKWDSERKKLKLKVSFGPPVVISSSRSVSRST